MPAEGSFNEAILEKGGVAEVSIKEMWEETAKLQLMEMDIIYTPAIQELRAQGVSQQELGGAASGHNRRIRSVVPDKSRLGPGGRIPYRFGLDVGMFLSIVTK